MSETGNKTEMDVVRYMEPTAPVSANGKGETRLVKDIGARLRQLAGLKPGSVSIRTPEMIEELLERLRLGETLLSICCDPHMPCHSTIHLWMQRDPDLDSAVQSAREVGTHLLYDARIDVALGGALSTGDRQRDELVLKVLDQTAAKRNRAAFGDRISVDATHSIATVVLPTIALPHIPDADYDDVGDDPGQ
jgi:hypothetical protein